MHEEENYISRIHVPSNKGDGMTYPIQPVFANPPFFSNMPPCASDFAGSQFPPTQLDNSPLATGINPFFPPLNSSIPSEHKRHRDTQSPVVKEKTPVPSIETHQKTDIFAEIQASAGLEVLKTRYRMGLNMG